MRGGSYLRFEPEGDEIRVTGAWPDPLVLVLNEDFDVTFQLESKEFRLVWPDRFDDQVERVAKQMFHDWRARVVSRQPWWARRLVRRALSRLLP